jgi:predicted ATPase
MLTELSLRNFKAFAEVSIPLGGLTLLTGLNSSGKSTALQALALLRQSRDAGVLAPDDGGSGFLLNGDLVELGVGRDVRHEEWVATDSAEGAIEIGLHDNGRHWRWIAAYGTEEDLLPLVDGPALEDTRDLSVFGTSFQYLRADRINPAVSYPRSHDVAIRRGFLGARGEHTVNYLRHHQDDVVRPELLHPDAASNTLLRQVEAWLGHLCPGVNLSATGIEGTDTVRLAFSFGTAGLSSSNPYRPTNVGYGLTYVLPIVVACLTAEPGGLILLENPEAHLHPRGQSAMARLAAHAVAAGSQLIIESHSDHVLNGVRLAVKHGLLPADHVALHYFHSRGAPKKFETPVVGPDGMLSNWPEGFFDEWDRSLDELID